MSFRVELALTRFENGITGKNQRDIIKCYLENVCDYMIYNEMGINTGLRISDISTCEMKIGKGKNRLIGRSLVYKILK
ncbi:putative phage transcriptional regulator, ArpU (plasmid) [Bacillus cereus E33L]|nr:putative phage transcriptional regulator, ArpU [Bacillus cereus E33L]